MRMKTLLFAIVGGVIITLLTGLIPNTKLMLLGANHYGFPFVWLVRLVLAPEYFPWRIHVGYLIADIIVWTVIVGAILFVVSRIRK